MDILPLNIVKNGVLQYTPNLLHYANRLTECTVCIGLQSTIVVPPTILITEGEALFISSLVGERPETFPTNLQSLLDVPEDRMSPGTG